MTDRQSVGIILNDFGNVFSFFFFVNWFWRFFILWDCSFLWVNANRKCSSMYKIRLLRNGCQMTEMTCEKKEAAKSGGR